MRAAAPESLPRHRGAFSAGFSAAMRGLRVAGRSPEVRGTYVQLVAVIFVIAAWLDVGGIWAIWHLTATDPTSPWWAILGLWTLRIAGILITLLIAPLIAFFAVNTFFPLLAERVFFAALRTLAPERARELEALPGTPFFVGVGRNLIRMLLFLGLTAGSFAVSLVPAVGAVVGPPLSLYVTARAMSWELLDPYFDKLQLTFADQRRVVNEHRAALVGFGLPIGLIMAIPLAGPLFFGLAQAAAAVLVAEVIEGSSSAPAS